MRMLRKALLVILLGILFALHTLPAFAQETEGKAAAAGLAIGSILIFICLGLVLLVYLAGLVIWILMLVDVIQREEKDFPGSTGNSKVIWLVILLASWVVVLYWVAAIAYYFIVKRRAEAQKEKAPPPPTEAPPPSEAGTPSEPAPPTE